MGITKLGSLVLFVFLFTVVFFCYPTTFQAIADEKQSLKEGGGSKPMEMEGSGTKSTDVEMEGSGTKQLEEMESSGGKDPEVEAQK